MSSYSASGSGLRERAPAAFARPQSAAEPITVMIVVPSLDGGAADAGAVSLARILVAGGNHVIVVSRMGRMVADVTAAGGEFIPLNVSSHNPFVILRNMMRLRKIAREKRCDIINAHGRAAAWSAYLAAKLAHVPFVTTWYKGFREQNLLKRLYNGIMVRGDRIVAVSEQLAQLINDRYGTPWPRIAVVPASVDLERFDSDRISRERVEAVRHAWGVRQETKVILIVGRILRRKGHDVVVRAAKRLKENGFKDFLCVFVGEDRGRTRYTGELWDLALSNGTVDVIRMAAPVTDMPAAYAAADVVVSAAVQPEGQQRAILEAQAMTKPVIVSDMGAGTDVVLTPPAVPEGRVTGLRFHAGSDAALAGALVRFYAMPEPNRRAIGARGRAWVLDHFDAGSIAEQTLRLYGEIARLNRTPAA